MTLKTLALAVSMALAAPVVFADDITMTVPLIADADTAGSYSAGLSATHLVAGTFTDTFTFDPSVSGLVSSSLATALTNDSDNIDFTSVMLNGVSFSLTSPDGGVHDFAFFGPSFATGPLTLIVTGVAAPALAAGTVISASYGGSLAVAVPEPQTYLLLLAGLGAVGFVARRRQS
jgi:hypothetical protein